MVLKSPTGSVQLRPITKNYKLRDFEGDDKGDQGLEGLNAQSAPYQADTRSPMCNTNTIKTTENCNAEERENLNVRVSWVQRLCSAEGAYPRPLVP